MVPLGSVVHNTRFVTPAFPDWLVPMAATLTQERFTGPEWIFERKFDGIRLLAFKQGTSVRLFSRNRLPQDIPRSPQAIATLPVDDAILDGEVTWEGQAPITSSTSCGSTDATSCRCRSKRAGAAERTAASTADAARGGARGSRSRGSARARKDGKASSRSAATRDTNTADRPTG